MPLQPSRTVAELRELQELTGDDAGAQRVAWTATWARRLIKGGATLHAESQRLREAIVVMAVPYEALRLDEESRKWIHPEIWKAIVEAREAARGVAAEVRRGGT